MSNASDQTDFDSRCTRLRQSVERCLQRFDIPGISLSCFEGDETCSIHAGYREAGTANRVDEQTVFAAASLGKPILAYIYMRCIEQGKVDLDAPLIQYGDYPDVKRLPGYQRVTARMVLSHQSGLPNCRSTAPLSLFQQPNGGFKYSGEGYTWLQFIVQKVLDAPLDEIAVDWVFGPLGMRRSSFIWRPDYEVNHAYPHGYRMNVQSKQKYRQPEAMKTLSTTSTDYAKFLREIINPQLLSASLAKEMLQPQVQIGKVGLGRYPVAWGLGFGWQSAGKRGWEGWHWGNLGGERSYLIFSPSGRNGLVYFANSINGLLCTRQFSDAFLGTPQPGYQYYRFNWRGRFKRIRAKIKGS